MMDSFDDRFVIYVDMYNEVATLFLILVLDTTRA